MNAKNPFGQNPFANFDFTDLSKWTEQIKVPGVDMQSVLEAQRKNLDAIAQANKLTIEGAQAIAQRQAEVLQSAMKDFTGSLQELTTVSAPQETMVKQADAAKTSFETAISNVRELSEMAAKSNSDALELINARISEGLDEMKTVMSSVADATPKAAKAPRSGKAAA
jgi:phasin family protein|tara:strand:- start:8532 stop:9032 length:501 start_codon:yes stop_codon:yes gene_type:complete